MTPIGAFTRLFTAPQYLCERITHSPRFHFLFSALWVIPGATLYLLFFAFCDSAGCFAWPHFMTAAILAPLAIDFSMSILLDDLISFFNAGVLSVFLGLLFFFGQGPGPGGLSAVIGVYCGAIFCLILLFGPFDIAKGKIRFSLTIVYYAAFLGILLLFSLFGRMLHGWFSISRAFPCMLLILGASWIVFSVNALSGLKSIWIIRLFLAISAVPVVSLSCLFPILILLDNSYSTALPFSFSFVASLALAYPLNLAGRVQGNRCNVDEARKCIETEAIPKVNPPLWLGIIGLVGLLYWGGWRAIHLNQSAPVIIIGILLIPLILYFWQQMKRIEDRSPDIRRGAYPK